MKLIERARDWLEVRRLRRVYLDLSETWNVTGDDYLINEVDRIKDKALEARRAYYQAEREYLKKWF